jgi:predicted nucleotidyltransferase
MLKKKQRDRLEAIAVELINLLSTASGVPLEDFGLHGSLALSMHTSRSDIDIVTYGARNFRKLERAIGKLVSEKEIEYCYSHPLDKLRRHRLRFKGKRAVYTAIRKPEEISPNYEDYRYLQVKPVAFSCTVTDDSQAMFRPAVYRVTNYSPLNSASKIPSHQKPSTVVSMIGLYRNIAQKGEKIQVSGMLEQVKHIKTGRVHFQVVVGSGTTEKEYIIPNRHLII